MSTLVSLYSVTTQQLCHQCFDLGGREAIVLEAKSRKNLQHAISLLGNNHRRKLDFAEISSKEKEKNCQVCLFGPSRQQLRGTMQSEQAN